MVLARAVSPAATAPRLPVSACRRALAYPAAHGIVLRAPVLPGDRSIVVQNALTTVIFGNWSREAPVVPPEAGAGAAVTGNQVIGPTAGYDFAIPGNAQVTLPVPSDASHLTVISDYVGDTPVAADAGWQAVFWLTQDVLSPAVDQLR